VYFGKLFSEVAIGRKVILGRTEKNRKLKDDVFVISTIKNIRCSLPTSLEVETSNSIYKIDYLSGEVEWSPSDKT